MKEEFKQLDSWSMSTTYNVKISKKGKVTVKINSSSKTNKKKNSTKKINKKK